MHHRVFFGMAAGAALVMAVPHLAAQQAQPADDSATTSESSTNWIMEALPPHLAARVEQQEANLLPVGLGQPAELVIRFLKVWPPEMGAIRVCFFGGSQDIRSRIADAALEWTRHEARIPLDFGDPQNPRQCAITGINHIRIGFAYKGYWSLVGQDSYNLANQNEQSMNLALYDINPPPEPEFSATVLHEFGHALGFEHEHQNPFSACEDDFDWQAIYTYLAGPPNYWSQEKVDHNMRRLHPAGLTATALDVDSIMKYWFPAGFYKEREDSECYSEPNYALSDVDVAAAAGMYPQDAQLAAAARSEALSTYTEALNATVAAPSERVRALTQVEVLSSPSLSAQERFQSLERLMAPSFQAVR